MAAPSNSSRGAQVWCCWCTSATPGSSLLSNEVAHPLFWAIFCFLVSWQTTSPSSTSYSFLLFFKLGMRSRLVVGGGGGGREEGSWDFKASLDDGPLFLSARRSFKPFLGLSAISSSSSSKLSSIFASMRLGVRTHEILSNSSLGFDMWMTGSPCSSLSSSS